MLHNQEIDYIKITDVAKNILFEELKLKEDAAGVKVFTEKKGCAGVKYNMRYISNKDENSDFIYINKEKGLKLFIDPSAILFLFDCLIDYEDNGIESGFKFINPNEKGKCGCGESSYL